MQKLIGLLASLCLFMWCAPSWASTSINKQFTPATINPGDITKFRITIYNTSQTPLTNASVTDILPSQILISNPSNISNTCGFTGVTSASGTSKIVLTGGTVPQNNGSDGQCYFELDVSSTLPGNWVNTIPANVVPNSNTAGYQASEGGTPVTNSTPASATLSVLNTLSPPTGSKTFSPSSINGGETSILTITLTNPNNITLPLTAFTDNLPAGMKVANTPASSVTCSGTGAVNGTFSPVAQATSLTLNGGTIGSNGTCILTVSVLGSTQGTLANNVAANAIGNTRGLTSAAFNASLTVNSPIGLSKSFSPSTVGPGQDALLTIDVTNASTTIPLTITSLTDSLPTLSNPSRALTVGDVVTTPPTIDCVSSGGGTNGTFSPALTQGASTITLVNAVVGTTGATRRCRITVPVRGAVSTATSVSTFNNSIPSGNGTTTGVINPDGYDSPSASANLGVNPNLVLTKSVNNTSPGPAVPVTYSVGIQNWTGSDLTNVSVTDSLPTSTSPTGYQMVLANPVGLTASGACSLATGSWTANAGATSIGVTGLTINKGANSGSAGVCTITFNALAPQNTPSGAKFTNTLPANTAVCNTGSPAVCNPAAASASQVTISSGASLTKSFSPTTMVSGQTSTLTITVTNNSGAAVSNATLTDLFPGGITVAPTPGVAGTCITGGGGSLTNVSGGALVGGESSVKLSGASIAASGNCTVSVKVTGSTVNTYSNSLSSSALTTNEGVTNSSGANASLIVIANPLGISKAFSSSSRSLGQSTRLTITLTNADVSDITGVNVTDYLPSGLVVASSPSGSTTCGNCQQRCPFFHAAIVEISTAFSAFFLGGLSHTSPTGVQFRMSPDQRSGFNALAAS